MDIYNLDKEASRILRTVAIWEKCSESEIIKKYIKLPAKLIPATEKTATDIQKSTSYINLLNACKMHMVRIGYQENLTDEQVIHIALRAYNGFMREGE